MRLYDKQVIILTHNDLDGIGPAVVARNMLPEDSIYCYYTANGKVEETIDKILEEQEGKDFKLFIVDHSPTMAHYEKLNGSDVDFHIFDHHKSSELIGLADDRVIIDMAYCATKLFFRHLHEQVDASEDLVKLVQHINDYDLWIHKDPHSKRLNELYYEMGAKYFVNRFMVDPDPTFTETEELLVSKAESRRERYIERAIDSAVIKKDREGNQYGIVYAESNQSELGNQIIIEKELEYVFLINPQSRKVSLRGAGNIDVADVAKAFASGLGTQGGGHKNAAGFTFEYDMIPSVFLMTNSR